MTKILHINCSDTGSTGGICQNIAKYCRKKGFLVYIASPFPKNKHDCFSYKINKSHFLNFINHVIARLFNKDGFCARTNTYFLIKYIKKNKFDIVHLHNLHDYFLDVRILFRFLSKSNIKVVWTIHDCWAITGKCTNFLHNGCAGWKNGCVKCNYKKEYPSVFLTNNTSKRLQEKKVIFDTKNLFLVAPSSWMANIISQSIAKEKTTELIYNGVSDIFLNKNISKKNQSNILNVFSLAYPWTPNKGLQTIINLSKTMTNDAIFVIGGIDNKLISSLPKTKNLVYLPKLCLEDVIKQFDLCDVFFNPSLEESFGLTNVEAQARGKPVVAINNSGGSVETIIDEVTGFLSENNLDNLKMSIIKAAKLSPDVCFDNAKKFSNTLMCENYYEFYLKILEIKF